MSLIRNLATLAATAFLLVGVSTGASAYQCKNTNTIAGLTMAPQAAALAGARAAWSNKVKNNYGLSWSVWNIAAGKQETCTPGAGGTSVCVVKAKPCNYVVP